MLVLLKNLTTTQVTGNNLFLMKTIDLISTSFDVNRTAEYRMSIREFTNGFSFCIIDDNTKECVAIKRKQRKEFKKIWEEEPLLQLPYKSIVIQTEDCAFAMVPDALYLAEKQMEYLPLSKHRKTRAQVMCEWVEGQKLRLLYDVRQSEFSQKSLTFTHPLSFMIQKGEDFNDSVIMIDIQEHNATIVFFQNKRVILANQYNFTEVEDIVYQIMSILNRFELDPEQIECEMWGDEELLETCLAILKEYIKNIHKPTVPNHWNYQFNKQLYWEFMTQIEKLSCE